MWKVKVKLLSEYVGDIVPLFEWCPKHSYTFSMIVEPCFFYIKLFKESYLVIELFLPASAGLAKSGTSQISKFIVI